MDVFFRKWKKTEKTAEGLKTGDWLTDDWTD